MLVSLPDLAATEKLVLCIAPALQRGDMIALQGPLGAGKTTFARALLRALGVSGEIPSPTFTLLQTYDTQKLPVYHFDLYRLKSAAELEELGWDDAFADGAVLVEWPERAGKRLPEDRLALHFAADEKGMRLCRIEPQGNWTQRLKDVA